MGINKAGKETRNAREGHVCVCVCTRAGEKDAACSFKWGDLRKPPNMVTFKPRLEGGEQASYDITGRSISGTVWLG